MPNTISPSRSRSPFTATTALLKQAVQERVFPGCAFAVSTASGLSAHGAVGRFRYEADSPEVERGTRYDLASLTKVLATTAAAMLLYDRNLLALDTPLQALLPGFAEADPSDARRAAVTLRMLLDHSSGLPGYGRLFESANDRRGIIADCLRQPLITDPGTRAEYSDIGFILLGQVLEQIAGEPLDSFCNREIFAPLGMRSTGYNPGIAARAAIPPTEDDRTFRHRIIQGEVHDENAFVMGGVSGHAGLFADTTDLLRYAECILADGLTASGDRLFAASTVALFATSAAQPAGSSRALGWDTPSAPSSAGTRFSPHSIGHLGFTGTSLWIDLDAGVAAVLLSNRTWPDRGNQAIRELRPRFHDILMEESTL